LSLDKTILLLAGKTTLLRDVTCMLADKFYKLVMVVDTSEEIAGGGNIPHACIGNARRMLGNAHQSKHQVMQEAVANHGPEVKLAATNAVSSCTSLATSVICCTINIVSIRADCAKPVSLVVVHSTT